MSRSFSKRSGSRRAVRRSVEELVTLQDLEGRAVSLEAADGEVGSGVFPLVVKPAVEGVDLASWGQAHRQRVHDWLHRHGSVLFTGFDVPAVESFEQVVTAVTGEMLDYTERAAPRKEVSSKVFTSTEFPADQSIPMHHEMSYSHNWPSKLWFYCVIAAESGGATPLVDDRGLLERIDPELRQRFLDKKVMYVRNYGEGVDLPWQIAFQTEDKAQVEAYCRAAGATVEWRDRDRLRTRSVRQVTATHPVTGQRVWFNHAHMFHVSNLGETVRRALLDQFEPDELPRNAFYGDGSPIADEDLEAIRALYRESAVRFSWKPGDVLLVDNFLASHGRDPFSGARRIVVSMADLYTDPEAPGAAA
ncbi:MAG: TauD/TfdA family dioxygenase [Acidobacteriota bacterium]